ncbi:YybH family protein [Methylocaldum sp.]|uniref:YybH family protein n=1 Tax=Methylocaldum sp. TaxID=1969727 RepID=UPI002D6A161A|nr:DUF4440 domain-containing protein [Methylocaldum sp.]HYE37546.1 DUF4440 domain-containing protein [Methylocaldum sp.]
MRLRITILVLVASLTIPGLVIGDSGSVQQIAETEIAKWNAAIARGSVEEILSLYAKNAILIQPNGAFSSSSEDIRNFWQPLVKSQTGNYSLRIVGVHFEKDDTVLASTVLTDTKRLGELNQSMRFHYNGLLYNVFKRQSDGNWKIQVQRWQDKNQN